MLSFVVSYHWAPELHGHGKPQGTETDATKILLREKKRGEGRYPKERSGKGPNADSHRL